MKKCVLIYNPNSGKGQILKCLDEFHDILNSKDYETTFLKTEYSEHAIKLIKSLPDDIDLVISAGGDGTFNEVVTGNFERKKRLLLAHIPIGTTNDIGTMFGYGKDPVKNLKLLMSGEIKQIDVCTINNNPFIYVAGFGKFMNIPYETKRKSKKRFGYLAYVLNAVKNFFKFTKMHDITYDINNETHSGLYSFLAVTNATRIAGVKIFDNIKLDDGKFEVLFCNLKKRKDIIKSLIRLRKTDITHVPGFYFHRSDYLKIKVNDMKNLSWCLDGEKYDIDGNTIEIKIDRNTHIMLPKIKIDELFTKKEG